MLAFAQFIFDPHSGKLFEQGKQREIRNKLIQLLGFFLAHPGEVISKDRLLKALWQQAEFRERSLSQSILELRKVLGDSASQPEFIRTIPNQGYQWISQVKSVPIKKNRSKQYLIMAVFSVFFVLSLLFWHQQGLQIEQHKRLKIAVLPFDNQTQVESLNWVEYGLSDMMAHDLMTLPNLQVITPNRVMQLSAGQHKLSPSLLKNLGLDLAITAQVKFGKEKQILEYEIMDNQGNVLSGQLKYKDLALSMPVISSQIYQQLKPQDSPVALSEHKYQVNAMHDYARGSQALALQGCILAQHYFAASGEIDQSHYWARLKQSACQIQLANFAEVEQQLVPLLGKNNELDANIHYWLTQLYYQQGKMEQAKNTLISSGLLTRVDENSNPEQQFQAYQLQAKIALSLLNSLDFSNAWQQLQGDDFLPPWLSIFAPVKIASIGKTVPVTALRKERNHPALLFALIKQARQVNQQTRLQLLDEAMTLAQQMQQPAEQVVVWLEIAYWQSQQGDITAALAATRQAKLLATNFQLKTLLSEARFLSIHIQVKNSLQQQKNKEGVELQQKIINQLPNLTLAQQTLSKLYLAWLNTQSGEHAKAMLYYREVELASGFNHIAELLVASRNYQHSQGKNSIGSKQAPWTEYFD